MKDKTVRLILLAGLLLLVSTFVMTGSAAALLSPISIMDNGEKISIGCDEIALYHAQMEAEEDGTEAPQEAEIEPCCAWMFRSLSAGIPALWGETIPDRKDIEITSHLVSCGAYHTGLFVTGTGEGIDTKSSGRLILLKPDGTELTDYSHESRSQIAKKRTLDMYTLELTSLSTGNSVMVSLRKEAFPDQFLELFAKVKTDPSVTKEEVTRFKALRSSFLENLLQKPDSELFTITKTQG